MGSDSICFMIEGKVDMHMDIADGLCMDRNLRNSCLMYAYLSKIHLKCHNKYEDCLTLFLTPTLFDDCYWINQILPLSKAFQSCTAKLNCPTKRNIQSQSKRLSVKLRVTLVSGVLLGDGIKANMWLK